MSPIYVENVGGNFLMSPIYVKNVFPQISKFLLEFFIHNPAGIYLFKVNNRNSRTMREICSS